MLSVLEVFTIFVASYGGKWFDKKHAWKNRAIDFPVLDTNVRSGHHFGIAWSQS